MFPPTSSTESVMVTELKVEHWHMAPMKGVKLKTLSDVITAESVIIREKQTLAQRIHLCSCERVTCKMHATISSEVLKQTGHMTY